MPERYLHDLVEQQDERNKLEQGNERLASIPQYPSSQSELPPLPPWYWRWSIRVWRIFPCTIISLPVFVVMGAVFQWGGDWVSGLGRGSILGLLFGCFWDSRFSMSGKMIDE